jgi:hypothetical protein
LADAPEVRVSEILGWSSKCEGEKSAPSSQSHLGELDRSVHKAALVPAIRPHGVGGGSTAEVHSRLTRGADGYVLGRDECLSLLPHVGVGRVGVSIGALPAIVPVNFAQVDDRVLFPVSDRDGLGVGTFGAVVAFEIDGFDDEESLLWTVMIRAIAVRASTILHERAAAIWKVRWPSGRLSDHCATIATTLISGACFGPHTAEELLRGRIN